MEDIEIARNTKLANINEIAKNLEKSINEVIPVITMMEIEGYAYQPQTNYFMRNVGAGELEEQE